MHQEEEADYGSSSLEKDDNSRCLQNQGFKNKTETSKLKERKPLDLDKSESNYSDDEPRLERSKRQANKAQFKEPSDLKIKKINERKSKYKRSTNNSHKKFICVARKNVFKYLIEEEKEKIQNGYHQYKNSRAYFFIILAHAKYMLTEEKINQFIENFNASMKNKIQIYKKEMKRAENKNFVHFRDDEIADIQFSIKALDLYFKGRIEAAIELLYKKEKVSVVKKQHYENALQIVLEIEQKLQKERRKINQKKLQQIKQFKINEQLNLEDQIFGKSKYITQKEIKKQGDKKQQPIKLVQQKEAMIDLPMLSQTGSYPMYSNFFPSIYPNYPMKHPSHAIQQPYYIPFDYEQSYMKQCLDYQSSYNLVNQFGQSKNYQPQHQPYSFGSQGAFQPVNSMPQQFPNFQVSNQEIKKPEEIMPTNSSLKEKKQVNLEQFP